jgi:hypothetical protein
MGEDARGENKVSTMYPRVVIGAALSLVSVVFIVLNDPRNIDFETLARSRALNMIHMDRRVH